MEEVTASRRRLREGRVRVKVTLTLPSFFTLTPVMPMNKGIEPMGEGVRVKNAITFICEKYFHNQEREVESSFVRFILIHNFQ